MPNNLKRYQESGSYHFVTFSCYHRLPYLDDDLIPNDVLRPAGMVETEA